MASRSLERAAFVFDAPQQGLYYLGHFRLDVSYTPLHKFEAPDGLKDGRDVHRAGARWHASAVKADEQALPSG